MASAAAAAKKKSQNSNKPIDGILNIFIHAAITNNKYSLWGSSKCTHKYIQTPGIDIIQNGYFSPSLKNVKTTNELYFVCTTLFYLIWSSTKLITLQLSIWQFHFCVTIKNDQWVRKRKKTSGKLEIFWFLPPICPNQLNNITYICVYNKKRIYLHVMTMIHTHHMYMK